MRSKVGGADNVAAANCSLAFLLFWSEGGRAEITVIAESKRVLSWKRRLSLPRDDGARIIMQGGECKERTLGDAKPAAAARVHV